MQVGNYFYYILKYVRTDNFPRIRAKNKIVDRSLFSLVMHVRKYILVTATIRQWQNI